MVSRLRNKVVRASESYRMLLKKVAQQGCRECGDRGLPYSLTCPEPPRRLFYRWYVAERRAIENELTTCFSSGYGSTVMST